LLSLVPEAADVLSDDDVPSDAELLSVEVVDVADVAESVELAVEASLPESLAADVICGGGGGGGGSMPVSVVSPEVVSADVPAVEVVDDEADEPFGGGGGGGAMAALLASPESPDTVVLLAEVVDDVSEGGGGCIVAVSVPPISSCKDSSADCMSLPSDEKALPDDTVLDVELLVCPSEEGGAKAVAADVPLLLDDPKRAARLPVLLVKAERDDICCLREKLPLQLWTGAGGKPGAEISEKYSEPNVAQSGCTSMSFSSQSRKARIFGWLRRFSG